jgi:FMN-dependent NADH-azoreductase
LAKQFASAETIVIATPYWDLSFPAVVKTYFENITVTGLTFAYGNDGIPQGLCNGKRLIYVTTAGGPIVYNFGYDYVSTLAKGFYGIKDVQCVKAEGLDIYGADVLSIMDKAKKSFNG